MKKSNWKKTKRKFHKEMRRTGRHGVKLDWCGDPTPAPTKDKYFYF